MILTSSVSGDVVKSKFHHGCAAALSIRESSRTFGISVCTLQNLAASEQIPFHRVGRRILVLPQSFEASPDEITTGRVRASQFSRSTQ